MKTAGRADGGSRPYDQRRALRPRDESICAARLLQMHEVPPRKAICSISGSLTGRSSGMRPAPPRVAHFIRYKSRKQTDAESFRARSTTSRLQFQEDIIAFGTHLIYPEVRLGRFTQCPPRSDVELRRMQGA